MSIKGPAQLPKFGIKVSRSPQERERERVRRAERLDGRTREGESVVEYQARMIGQINSLDWGSEGDDEPEL